MEGFRGSGNHEPRGLVPALDRRGFSVLCFIREILYSNKYFNQVVIILDFHRYMLYVHLQNLESPHIHRIKEERLQTVRTQKLDLLWRETRRSGFFNYYLLVHIVTSLNRQFGLGFVVIFFYKYSVRVGEFDLNFDMVFPDQLFNHYIVYMQGRE